MNRDTWTGILGAVILVAAMVGVFQYERTIGAARAGILDADFTLESFSGPGAEGTTALGESTSETLGVNATGLVNVTFTLTWTAAQGTDTLRLEVTPPDGVPAPEAVSGDSGSLTITVPVGNPQPTAGAPADLGTGDWAATVTFEANSALADTPAGPLGGDGSVGWTLTSTLEAWQPASAE